MAEAREARAAGQARAAKTHEAQTRAAKLRAVGRSGRKLAKLALVSRLAPGSPAAKLAAAEEGQEFGAWTTAWHHKHSGASLAEEQAAWRARTAELGRIAAWEARQARRVTMIIEEPASADQPETPDATIENVGDVINEIDQAVVPADEKADVEDDASQPEEEVNGSEASEAGVASKIGEASVSPLADIIKNIGKMPAASREHSDNIVASVFPADVFRCVASIERGVKGVKASGASSADIMSAVRSAMDKKHIQFGDVEKRMKDRGITFDDVAEVMSAGSFADMQRVMAEKHIDMQDVSKVMAHHHIACSDIAELIKSVHTKPAAAAAEEKESKEEEVPVVEDTAGEQEATEPATEEEESKEETVPEVEATAGAEGATSASEEEVQEEQKNEETPEEEAAQEEKQAEEEVETGIRENVAEEDAEETTPASSSSYGRSGWGSKEVQEESPLSPEERIAQARRDIADSHKSVTSPARAEYMEHKAYWSRAKAHMADEPCVPASFWFGGSIDPRPKCKKAAPVLNYATPKALPPAPVAGPYEGEGEQQHMAEPTVLGVPDGPPDFNGNEAVIAHHPFMGPQPTDLEERGGETRGSFSVVSAPSGFDNEGDVQLAIYGPPKTPIGCKIRGYRKLSGDFQGNVISTGFSDSWQSLGEIQTGPISPGVTNEYDIITCRDQKNGETQHFRLSWGSSGYNDLKGHGPVRVVGSHTGMNTDSVTFDMDRPTYEDERAIDDYYALNYNPLTDDKPFSSGPTE